MNYELYKVFDIILYCKDSTISELFHEYGIECTESPKLYYFHIKESPTGEDDGLGHLTTDEMVAMTSWLISEGAEIGETVIIDNHW